MNLIKILPAMITKCVHSGNQQQFDAGLVHGPSLLPPLMIQRGVKVAAKKPMNLLKGTCNRMKVNLT